MAFNNALLRATLTYTPSTWAIATMPSSGWQGVCYGGGKFVAVGNAKAAYSSDGISWTNVPLTYNYLHVAYGNGVFIAIGAAGQFAKSSDGISWNETYFSLLSNCDHVLYEGGSTKFFFAGYQGTPKNIASSTSPYTGSGAYMVLDHYYGSGPCLFFRFLNGTWIVKLGDGYLLTSTDGVNFTTVSTAFGYEGVDYINGKWIAWVNSAVAPNISAKFYTGATIGSLSYSHETTPSSNVLDFDGRKASSPASWYSIVPVSVNTGSWVGGFIMFSDTTATLSTITGLGQVTDIAFSGSRFVITSLNDKVGYSN